jgi:hypothetical protein
MVVHRREPFNGRRQILAMTEIAPPIEQETPDEVNAVKARKQHQPLREKHTRFHSLESLRIFAPNTAFTSRRSSLARL